RKTSRYEGLHPEPINKNASALSDEEIHALAYEIVEREFDAARREARERIEAALQEGSGRASNRLEEIIPAAHHGRVDSLFVATDSYRWGRFDPAEGTIVEHEQRAPGDVDLLDMAAA